MPTHGSSRRIPTTPVGTLNVILALMKQVGVDTDEVLARVDLSSGALQQRERISVATMVAIWDAAEKVSRNPMLGFEVGELAKPEMLDVVGYCMKHGDTLEDVIERWTSYARLLGDLFLFELVSERDQVAIRWTGAAHYAHHPQAANAVLAGTGAFGDYLLGHPLETTEVRFAYPRPDHAPAIEAYLESRATRVTFDAAYNAIVFPRSWLAEPNTHRDPQLLEIIERQAKAMLEELSDDAGLSVKVSSVIAEALKGGDAGSARVAEQLGMSQRTMRRRLDEVGVQYRDLFDQVRRDLASRYLRDTDMDIGEIAFNLTFASIGSFGRAFKRWTGSAPSDYRKQYR